MLIPDCVIKKVAQNSASKCQNLSPIKREKLCGSNFLEKKFL